MIPILFSPSTTDFSNFGLGHLSDAISPKVVEERNGEFTLEMQYPLDGEHFSDIAMRSIILAKPSPAQDPQPFRVFRISKPINGIVTINARHVRYDLEGVPVTPFTANGIANALAAIKSHAMFEHPFTFSTNKTTTSTMTLSAPASTLSLLGGTHGSLLDIYGGEYKYNLWNINLMSSRGTDNHVVIRYGVDLTDFQQEENCANVYTGVMCFWKEMSGNTIVTGDVQSSGTFDYQRILVVDKSMDYESAPTVAQLNQAAADYINANKVGVPKVAINLSFANLEQTAEYANIRQSIELCDQITVEFPKIGVSAMSRIIRTSYDVINEKYISVEIGDSRTSLADSFVAVQTKAESAPTSAEMQQAINVTTAAITGANGGAVRLLDTNGDDLPDTLYIADNPSPLLASKVWRFNYEGWGASQNGYSGPFTMGATFQQGFLAEFITAGTLNADRIGANSITVSKLTGKINGGLSNSWEIDLTNGTMTIGNLSANNITAGTLNVDRIASNSVGIGKLTGSITNNNWTIDLTNGTLTIGNISANNINTGTLSADRIGANTITIDKLTSTAQGSIVSGVSTKTEYYLSTSNSSATGGSWSTSIPTWSTGKYLWTRDVTTKTFADGTSSTTYSPSASGIYDKNLTTALSTSASGSSAANSANAKEQLVYISKASGTTSVTAPTSWVSNTTGNQNTWTIKRPTYNSSYPVLFIATQRQTVGGTVTCTTPMRDDTTTVIDGGHITTGTIDANVVTVSNLNASNISSGTLNANRIGANSIAVSKLTGSISANGWMIDLDAGTFTIGNISASKINTGTLSASRIGANSIAVSKLTGSITNGTGSNQWKIDLDNGTFTIGTISASKITSGTIDASEITVRNLNADNITTGTLNGEFIETNSVSGSKIKDNTLGGAKLTDYAITESKIDDLAISNSKIKNSTISGGKIQDLTITGSNIADTTLPGDKLENYTLTDTQVASGGLSTWSTNDYIDTGVGGGYFADDVFHDRDTAPYCHASNMECDRLLETRFLSVNGTEAAWTTQTIVTWVGQEQQWAYAQTDQGSGMYKAFLLYQGTNVLSSSDTLYYLG